MGKRQHQDQPFTPDTVDEQIEQLLHQQEQKHNQTKNAQIIRDLHTLYEEDADVLARVRERFVASITESDEAQQPVALHQYQSGRFHSTAQQNASLSFKSTSRRRLSLLVAGLVAALIVGSMLTVFTFARHPGTQVASPQQQTPAGLYMGNGDMVYRIDKGSGKVLWQYHLKDDPKANFGSHPPVVVMLNPGPDNTVYAVSESTVYAIDATSGTLRWSNTLFKRVLTASKPIVSGNRVYVTANDSVYALSTADGKVLATYSVGATVEPKQLTPVAWKGGVRYKIGNYAEVVQNAIQATVNDNILYITTQYDNVYALRLPDGKQLWHRQVNQQLSAPQVVNGLVYVSSEDSPLSKTTDYIYAFNAQTGATAWQSKTEGDVYNITVDHGVLYGSVVEKSVFAYDARTGKALWSQNTGVAGIDAPQVDGNTVYITTFDNNTNPSASNKNNSLMMIDPLDATNGDLKNWVLLWDQSSLGDISIIAQNGVIYVREKGSGITAWNTNRQTKIWHSQLGDKSTRLTFAAV